MGVVFSCLASTFMYMGELLEQIFLAIGEIGSILIRAVFSLLVGLCDVLAAISCCCTVPWSQRPDRSGFNVAAAPSTLAVTAPDRAARTRTGVIAALCTREGRLARKEQALARKKEKAIADEEKHAADLVRQKEQAADKAKKIEQQQKDKKDKAAAKEASKKAKDDKAAAAAATKAQKA